MAIGLPIFLNMGLGNRNTVCQWNDMFRWALEHPVIFFSTFCHIISFVFIRSRRSGLWDRREKGGTRSTWFHSAMVLRRSYAPKWPGASVAQGLLGSTSRGFESVGLRWSLRPSRDVGTVGLGSAPEEPLRRQMEVVPGVQQVLSRVCGSDLAP